MSRIAESPAPQAPSAEERAQAVAGDPARLEVLHRTGLLDAGIQETLQRYVRLASTLTGSPISLVSLIDASRQYFSAAHGLSEQETPLEYSWCKYVVADGAQLCVPDAREDAVLSHTPAATELGVRAYLGAPIVAEGAPLGAFCVVDMESRPWDERHRQIVDDLAAAVSAEISLRMREIEQRQMARTDALTGIGNRRALAEALRDTLDQRRSAFLGMFDLDGFKAYNDCFGHPAGDDLLVRAARRLTDAVAPNGRAYRMGGDEFCVLVDEESLLHEAQKALVERGGGFEIGASMGTVDLGSEADDVTAAIGTADRRLYATKRSRQGSAAQQITAALSMALAQHDNDLGGHSDQVSELARSIGSELRLDENELRGLEWAARLHDIGKMAIPDHVLHKPGPLSAEEWALMRCHTLIGERILAAAPALAEVAQLVRSSHERWDGGGYPDGLREQEIPLGARIICACDALDAMTKDRPYRRAMKLADATTELRRCAGSQFDPQVVQALLGVLGGEAVSTSSLG